VRPTPYWVHWVDHAKTDDAHPDPTLLQPVTRYTIGWLVAKDAKRLTLAMDVTYWPGTKEYEYGFSIDRRTVIAHGKLKGVPRGPTGAS